uniref:Uncharacterized protein n=1 Tax=Anguilla anguilla TaxID=7936 RepID=A0A0E9W737_ANGAN
MLLILSDCEASQWSNEVITVRTDSDH